MVETANNVFRLPRCNKKFPQDIGKGRPCLNAHIGLCMAVCSGKISREMYGEAVDGALHLIRHGQGEILKLLRQRMEEAAEKLDFERAAMLRDQINAIEKVSRGQKVVRSSVDEQDVFALAASATAVCAAILRFREGRLVDKREFLFHDTQDVTAVRNEFLPRYYLEDSEFIPKSIAVDQLPDGWEDLRRLLEETRGSKVQLHVQMCIRDSFGDAHGVDGISGLVRGKTNYFFYTGFNSGRQYVVRSDDVGAHCFHGEELTAWHLLQGGGMEHEIHSAHNAGQAAGFTHIANIKFDLTGQLRVFELVVVPHIILLLFVAGKNADLPDVTLQKML